MSSNRRSFLQMAGLVPAVAATGFAAPRVAAAAVGEPILERSTFLPCVGEAFTFEIDTFKQCTATLARIDPLMEGGKPVQGEGKFNLLFKVAAGGRLEQASYRVSHPRLGHFVLFVSPNDAEGRVVEAVFNRL
jgi:hypothetical protein